MRPGAKWPASLQAVGASSTDHGLLRPRLVMYDALFAYLRFAPVERHNRPAKAA
jgi:hypothetical protein